MALLLSLLFPLKPPEAPSYKPAIKWQIVNSKYKIHATVLKKLDIPLIVPHCLEIKNRVESVIRTPAHVGPSLFRVMRRTLSSVIQTEWDSALAENAYNAPETVELFETTLKFFIKNKSTQEDRHDLLQQLRQAKKPRDLSVNTFYLRLLQLNEYVKWLPGTAQQLDNDQIKMALYSAMPEAWQQRLSQSGQEIGSITVAQAIRYFRNQEIKSNKSLKLEQKGRLLLALPSLSNKFPRRMSSSSPTNPLLT